MAQLASARRSGRRGRRFKSGHPDQKGNYFDQPSDQLNPQDDSKDTFTSPVENDDAREALAQNSEVERRVKRSLDFLRNQFELQLDESGNFTQEPTPTQLNALHRWREETFTDGIEMNDIDTFTTKVILARALMPQQGEDGTTYYLFGKGVGAELALQGEVVGRTKTQESPDYRTHSDFEIYAVSTDDYMAIPHSERFRAVFGSQEIYPVTATKGLHGLPETLLHDTAELVNYGGISFLVPQLEVQFVDKFEKHNATVETNLRAATDHELLARTYQLDREHIHQLIDRYVVKPELQKFENPTELAIATLPRLLKKIESSIEVTLEDFPNRDRDTIVDHLSVIFAESYARKFGISNLREVVHGNGAARADGLQNLERAITEKQDQARQLLKNKHVEVDAILERTISI